MENNFIYLDLDSYLRQWLIHEHGGEEPVKMLRGSIENDVIQTYISRKPEGWVPVVTDQTVRIVIPRDKRKNPHTWCYLGVRPLQALKALIKQRFDAQFMMEVIRLLNKSRELKMQLIYAFMEKHGIEDTETNYNTLAKICQRKVDDLKRSERAEAARKKRNREKMGGRR